MTKEIKPYVPKKGIVKKIRKHMEDLDINHVLWHESPISKKKAIELRNVAESLSKVFDEMVKAISIHEAPDTGWYHFEPEHYDNGDDVCRASRFCPDLIKDSWTPGLEGMAVIKYNDYSHYRMEICVNDGTFSYFHKDFALTSENPDTLKQFMMLAAASCKTVQEWYELAKKESKK